jgi:uncharacterized membrane protein HdeD (DUF308 family)
MISTLIRPLSASSLAWRGIVSVLFAIVALAWPGMTLVALTLLFGAYSMADGVFALIVAAQGKTTHRWLFLLDGLFGIGIGVMTMFLPGLTLLVLIFMVGARFLIMGGLQIAAAVQLRKDVPLAILYGLGGLAAIVVGVLAFILPGITAFALVTMLAVYSLVFGFTFLTLAILTWRSSRPRHEGGMPMHAT